MNNLLNTASDEDVLNRSEYKGADSGGQRPPAYIVEEQVEDTGGPEPPTSIPEEDTPENESGSTLASDVNTAAEGMQHADEVELDVSESVENVLDDQVPPPQVDPAPTLPKRALRPRGSIWAPDYLA